MTTTIRILVTLSQQTFDSAVVAGVDVATLLLGAVTLATATRAFRRATS